MKRSEAGAAALTFAVKQLGEPYVYGAEGPNTWDCSGLTQGAWNSVGVHLPRTTQEQCREYVLPTNSDHQQGDLLFFHAGPQGPEHVGMYVSPGRMLNAPHTGANVRFDHYNEESIVVCTRPALAFPPDLPQPKPPKTHDEKILSSVNALSAELRDAQRKHQPARIKSLARRIKNQLNNLLR